MKKEKNLGYAELRVGLPQPKDLSLSDNELLRHIYLELIRLNENLEEERR